LGRRFRAEIDSVVQSMADNPRQFPVVYKTLRRARTKRFPYALFFLTEPDCLLIVAGWNCCNTESTISSGTCGAGFSFNPAAEDRAEVIRISMPRRMRYRNRRVAMADISA